MKLVENISKHELDIISETIGKAFINNNLFYEFGSVESRRELVLKYMKVYVECVYTSKALYRSDDGESYIGLCFSDKKAVLPQLKMLFSLIRIIPLSISKKFIKFVKEIRNDNHTYINNVYLEVLMVVVKKQNQGKGKARELVDFAKQMAKNRNVPLLFDTDMKEYAEMYQHFGCELYHTKAASNGVTRYNLVWKP